MTEADQCCHLLVIGTGPHVLCLGQVDPGIGVTLCRQSAEPRRDDIGDDVSLGMPPARA